MVLGGSLQVPALSKLEHITPKLEHITPKLEHITPKLEHITPKLEHITPKFLFAHTSRLRTKWKIMKRIYLKI
jgi:hypothetical protein